METNESPPPPPTQTDDKFYRGTIYTLHRGAQRGTIRSANGREIPFIFVHVTMLGRHRRFEDLHEGVQVGYDVSWTSRGLRGRGIKIPD